MAFMMPVVKKNYALYASPGSSVPTNGDPRQRRISDQVNGRSNPKVAIIGPSGATVGRRRKAKSEGQSLSTSPGGILISSGVKPMKSRPVDMGMGRGRSSASIQIPVTSHSVSFQHSSHRKLMVPCSSAPTNAPIHGDPLSQSRSSNSISSSSSSSSDSTTKGKKFHSKLVMRLRKTFKIKDNEPSST